MVNALPDLEFLNSILEYRDGKLYWKKQIGNKGRLGSEAGHFGRNGRRVLSIQGKRYLTHRVVWKMVKGEEPPEMLDHIDRDYTNNRIENLRPSDPSHNQINRETNGGNFKKGKNKWVAKCIIKGKEIYLGYHNTPEEAKSRCAEFKELYLEMIDA